jgi:hypothetical protein
VLPGSVTISIGGQSVAEISLLPPVDQEVRVAIDPKFVGRGNT